MTSWIKKWVPVLSLAVVPLAQAQSAGAMDSAKQTTVDTTRSSTPTEDAQEKQIQALQREVDAIKVEAADPRTRKDDPNPYLTDEELHPLYP